MKPYLCGFFPPTTGCQVPALRDECPALHIAEDQVDGQGKSTAGSTNTFLSIQNNEMNQIQTKDSAPHCCIETRERTQRKVLWELIISQLRAVQTACTFITFR